MIFFEASLPNTPFSEYFTIVNCISAFSSWKHSWHSFLVFFPCAWAGNLRGMYNSYFVQGRGFTTNDDSWIRSIVTERRKLYRLFSSMKRVKTIEPQCVIDINSDDDNGWLIDWWRPHCLPRRPLAPRR